MPMAVSSISKSGQITLPKEFRAILGVGVHDQVALLSDGKRVELVAVPANPLALNDEGGLWERLAVAEDDIAQGRVRPSGSMTAEMREKYAL